ncbi:protein translocase subunit SecF [Dehalococcoides mccartyi]|jgi:preprotein translocase subunit SecF|uniref:Protein-export membrane protein SecF n=3 Tax=Dehalococcoides mccartyi TaxID=61435 RepID=A0A142V8Y0_9CHLR|nr:protein translocase subunit SecF [Dehalococcoides mccartyi]AII60447.1 preprotein translocase subunit SecF [Dehalococcoides mccartyi CG5]AMU86109.1 preprotein translocuse subunit SecF [Dehalococcoides mccartyi]AOV98951.1 protein-export membrane protein [Dehalococcoides mccartyi]MBA2084717.1 Protein translocase subunit SecF [Dehalococcoides mccartyi]QBX63463.1 protein translocase subunit SecF [Dehalococcoides mccartyi]
MNKIIQHRPLFIFISALIILAGLASLLIFGLKPGIEFSSGSMLTVKFDQTVSIDELTQELRSLGQNEAIVQVTGDGDYLIRTSQLDVSQKISLETSLEETFGNLTERGFENVDPMIARQTTQMALIAIGAALVGILLYVTWAFRRMPKPFHYGTCAVIALFHDALVVLGIFALLAGIFGWEINLMFIIGIMAVIGYSINNTVVVFDRIRENQLKGIHPSFEVVVNQSIMETIVRSINSSFTVIITVVALMLFLGASIQNLSIVMLIGLIAGTYDSLFVAPSLLVTWENGDWGKLLKPFKKA